MPRGTMTHGRHASRASFACLRCKRDKRRCDISQSPTSNYQNQSCTACRNRNEKCVFRQTDDRRSQRQPQNGTEALHRRIATLENQLKSTLQALDELSNSRNVDKEHMRPSSQNAAEANSLTRSEIPTPANSISPGPHSEYTSAHLRNGLGVTSQISLSSSETVPLCSISQSSRTEPEVHSVSDCFPSVRDEIATTSLQSNSREQTRSNHYFGSPSLFPYAEHQSNVRETTVGVEVVTMHGETNQDLRSESEAYPEPEPIVTHLLDIFWKWQSSHLLVVHRDIFLRYRKLWDESGGKSDRNFYSPCLLYSILSMASMVSTDRGVKRYSAEPNELAGERFCKRARALFDIEMQHPTVATVQAAMILGSRYGTMIDNSLGWTFSGIAFRIASKLGLHLDCSRALASGQMTEEMAEIRRTAFWGCYIEDNLFSSYTSRPTFFMDWDITIPIPEPPLLQVASKANIFSPFLLHTTSTLSILTSKILVGLYGQKRRSTANQLSKLAFQINKDLWQWHQDLPEDLAWPNDETTATRPEVFALHMHFYFVLILLHRPFLKFSQVLQDLNSDNGSVLNSTTTCAIAAANITKLAVIYQRWHSIKQVPSPTVHIIFIAGTIHLVNFRLTKVESYYHLLQSCMAALSDMRESYPIARKAASVLQDLIEDWKPSEVSEDVCAQDRQTVPPRLATTDRDQSSDWLAIEVPPLMEMEGLIDMEPNLMTSYQMISDYPLSAQGDLGSHEQLDFGSFGTDDSIEPVNWPQERALFETIYGNAFALT